MPIKDKAGYNAYMRQYVQERYARRRADVVRRLGGYCWECYETSGLDIDHIDPADKAEDWTLAGLSDAKVEVEIAKCQLLCADCHAFKSIVEQGKTPARGTHGTISAYRHCGPPKCEACREAKRVTQNAWRKRGLDKDA